MFINVVNYDKMSTNFKVWILNTACVCQNAHLFDQYSVTCSVDCILEVTYRDHCTSFTMSPSIYLLILYSFFLHLIELKKTLPHSLLYHIIFSFLENDISWVICMPIIETDYTTFLLITNWCSPLILFSWKFYFFYFSACLS